MTLSGPVKKTLAAALAVATIGSTMLATTGSAEAQWRRGGWGRGAGWGVGAGVVGGLAAGALIAGAARPYYGYPAYGYPVYDDYAPVCHIERRQVWIDSARYTYRNVRVCE